MQGTYYHSSEYKQFKFDLSKSKEVGLHCGTREQAEIRANGNPKYKYIHKFIVDTIRMFRFRDIVGWHGSQMCLSELHERGIISDELYKEIDEELRSNFVFAFNAEAKQRYCAEQCRQALLNKDFTGYIYKNKAEVKKDTDKPVIEDDYKDSICVIDKSAIIKYLGVETLKENINTALYKEFELYENLWN